MKYRKCVKHTLVYVYKIQMKVCVKHNILSISMKNTQKKLLATRVESFRRISNGPRSFRTRHARLPLFSF